MHAFNCAATVPATSAVEMLPLRQFVSPHGDAARAFARQELLECLSRPGRFQILCLGGGAQIRAASEAALAEARGALRQVYGSTVGFGETVVHTYVDAKTGCVMTPSMFLRIDAPRQDEQDVLALLREKAAELEELGRQRDRVLVRAQVLLPRGLGLESRVQALTAGRAHVLSWLTGYRCVAGCGASARSAEKAPAPENASATVMANRASANS